MSGGFSVYKGVIVQWHNGDQRVLDLLDILPPHELHNLLIVHERKAHVHMVWKDRVPYDAPYDYQIPDGDVFTAEHSAVKEL